MAGSNGGELYGIHSIGVGEFQAFISLSLCVGVLSTEITQRFRHLLVLSLYLVGKLVFRVVP
jgi:hypothetical protein